MSSAKQALVRCLENTEHVRNLCVLAHVDHGKTSLSDTLLASNGIISWTLQGSIRYLDSRPDEQDRGITMESSAVSLYTRLPRIVPDMQGPPIIDDYIINLIDSPGHIDFSSEVSTASRLCDSALIVVDAAEGVMSQTITVLKQAWDEELAPILVVNKIDRLIVEFQMSPTEAYNHICQLLEQVNAVLGSFFSGSKMEQDYSAATAPQTEDFMDDSSIYFDPSKNNVIFCSALDGWGFNIGQFAGMYAKKMGFKREKLEKVLWGNFYFDNKTKRVVSKPSQLSGSAAKSPKPMAVQLIFESIWSIYTASDEHNDAMVEKIVKSMDLKIAPNNLKSNDEKVVRRALFNAWIPVARSVLAAVARLLPSPKKAQKDRIKTIVQRTRNFDDVDPKVVDQMARCDPRGEVVAFISKVLHLTKSEMTKIDPELCKDDNDSPEDVFIGVSRVFSGTIKVGAELELHGPLYDPAVPEEGDKITVTGLYILMGRDLVPVQVAYPGNIIGIAGLGEKVVKCATLLSPNCRGPSLASSDTIAAPILQVAVEPRDPTQLTELEKGLELLNMSDPSVETWLADNGEYILATAGELHLERCLKDLEEKFAKVEIDCSPPVVPFLETCIDESGDTESKIVEATTANIKTGMAVIPLPQSLRDAIASGLTTKEQLSELPQIKEVELLAKNLDRILHVSATNASILVDATSSEQDLLLTSATYKESIVNGFTDALKAGPLAGEPLYGILCAVVELQVLRELDHPIGALVSRRLISSTKRLVHSGVSEWSPRLMLATYKCEVQAPTEVLGKVYAVITRRKGKVLDEQLKDGTTFFNIIATVPMIESLGFSEEIRKKTSGAANPQLKFDGFAILDEDPFWIPTTEEQLEHFGETADKQNQALVYLDSIRKRKGLKTMEKLVTSAEQVRTFKST